MSIQGILNDFNLRAEQSTVLYPYLREVFINECPLITMLPRERADGQVYNTIVYDVRPRTYTLTVAVSTTGQTTFTLSDASPLQVGDVLRLVKNDGSAVEHVEVTADPNVGANTIVVRRARGNTTATTNDLSGNTTITLIGNSRTGAEGDQTATRSIRTPYAQAVQTFEFPVHVGRVANATSNTRLPNGISNVFSLEQKVKMTELMRDEEYSAYYSLYEAPAATGDRAKQRGLRQWVGLGNNLKTTGGGSYTKLNFLADTVQKCIVGGGNPDIALVSNDFMFGLSTWSVGLQQFSDPRKTPFLGIPIKEFEAPFLGHPVVIVPSYQLNSGTVFVGTSSDMKVRYIEEESFAPRGRRGSALEGDFYADTCIEVGHPNWHSWVEGITGWA